MAGNIRLEVVTPEKSVVSEEAQIVVAPGSLGDFGVLIGHTTFLSSLRTGCLTYKNANGQERSVFINGGFSEVLPKKVTVLAESAERRKDIDVQRAQAALDRAQDRVAKAKQEPDIDYARAKAALNRAMQRLRIAGNKV